MAREVPALAGPQQRGFSNLVLLEERDIAYALILARVARPKLVTTKWSSDTTLVADLDLEGVSTDEVHSATDWLGERQSAIATKLVRRHLSAEANPSRLAYFD